ncbi:MAG: type II toxin-antitoxin system VapC family toxin [Caldimonas sp.]|uniref:type II toxin-antitoxin system VapC family toxin n=1 Tax=Caldimonas sp. TaxID=2838790 RepID=UPI00391BF57C
MRFLLDTNICIHLIQRQPPELLARFDTLKVGEAVMSVVTLAELRHGVERDTAVRDRADRALARLLEYLPALPFGEAQAHRYGVLAAAVKDRRRDALDRLIAAHALSLDLTLVTNNEADFAGYPGLQVENWLTGHTRRTGPG